MLMIAWFPCIFQVLHATEFSKECTLKNLKHSTDISPSTAASTPSSSSGITASSSSVDVRRPHQPLSIDLVKESIIKLESHQTSEKDKINVILRIFQAILDHHFHEFLNYNISVKELPELIRLIDSTLSIYFQKYNKINSVVAPENLIQVNRKSAKKFPIMIGLCRATIEIAIMYEMKTIDCDVLNKIQSFVDKLEKNGKITSFIDSLQREIDKLILHVDTISPSNHGSVVDHAPLPIESAFQDSVGYLRVIELFQISLRHCYESLSAMRCRAITSKPEQNDNALYMSDPVFEWISILKKAQEACEIGPLLSLDCIAPFYSYITNSVIDGNEEFQGEKGIQTLGYPLFFDTILDHFESSGFNLSNAKSSVSAIIEDLLAEMPQYTPSQYASSVAAYVLFYATMCIKMIISNTFHFNFYSNSKISLNETILYVCICEFIISAVADTKSPNTTSTAHIERLISLTSNNLGDPQSAVNLLLDSISQSMALVCGLIEVDGSLIREAVVCCRPGSITPSSEKSKEEHCHPECVAKDESSGIAYEDSLLVLEGQAQEDEVPSSIPEPVVDVEENSKSDPVSSKLLIQTDYIEDLPINDEVSFFELTKYNSSENTKTYHINPDTLRNIPKNVCDPPLLVVRSSANHLKRPFVTDEYVNTVEIEFASSDQVNGDQNPQNVLSPIVKKPSRKNKKKKNVDDPVATPKPVALSVVEEAKEKIVSTEYEQVKCEITQKITKAQTVIKSVNPCTSIIRSIKNLKILIDVYGDATLKSDSKLTLEDFTRKEELREKMDRIAWVSLENELLYGGMNELRECVHSFILNSKVKEVVCLSLILYTTRNALRSLNSALEILIGLRKYKKLQSDQVKNAKDVLFQIRIVLLSRVVFKTAAYMCFEEEPSEIIIDSQIAELISMNIPASKDLRHEQILEKSLNEKLDRMVQIGGAIVSEMVVGTTMIIQKKPSLGRTVDGEKVLSSRRSNGRIKMNNESDKEESTEEVKSLPMHQRVMKIIWKVFGFS